MVHFGFAAKTDAAQLTRVLTPTLAPRLTGQSALTPPPLGPVVNYP
jgi:hypothetical protein